MKRRRFSAKDIDRLMAKQGGKCALCGWPIEGDFHRDHVIPLAAGGADEIGNIQLVHPSCHRRKTADEDMAVIAKTRRVKARHDGTRKPSKAIIPGSKRSRWKKGIDGKVMRR